MKKYLILIGILLIAQGIVSAQNLQNKKANTDKKVIKTSATSKVNNFSTYVLKEFNLEVKTEDEAGSFQWKDGKDLAESYAQGWRLPDKAELDCLYKNKDKIGNFKRDWYWSSVRVGDWNVWVQSFSNGKQFGYSGSNSAKVRCVRSLKK